MTLIYSQGVISNILDLAWMVITQLLLLSLASYSIAIYTSFFEFAK